MKGATTIQERLKDLRVECRLKLEDVAAATGISKSALGSYENNDYKEINHGNLIILAKFYDVSMDYLLCLTENRKHANTELSELHLSDEMIELLKSGSINNRLLCEIATHEKFKTLLADTEIYVDGIATMRFQDLNSLLEMTRAEVLARYQPQKDGTALKTLQASQIQEEDFFCHATHKTWDAILHAIRDAHKNDRESAPDGSNSLDMLNSALKALQTPGTYLDVFCHIICEQLQIKYEKLSDQDRDALKRIMKKSGHYKDSPLVSRKRR